MLPAFFIPGALNRFVRGTSLFADAPCTAADARRIFSFSSHPKYRPRQRILAVCAARSKKMHIFFEEDVHLRKMRCTSRKN